MVGKRGPSDMSPPKSGGKRQQTLKSSFQNASKPRRAPVEQQVQPQLLNQEHVHQLEQAVESYCLSWGQKCKQDSNYNIGGAARDDVDLDGRGMLVVRAFTDALELATARSEMLEPRFLESLVLVLRNDAVHQHSHVSRAAYMALMSYFAAHPGAKAKEYPADGEAVGQPYVVLNTQAVWTPLAT